MMNAQKFSRVSESLRQYRRAELKDFAGEIGGNPIDDLYVDPLPSDAVLSTVLSGNTMFLTGRKGTGKSTIFAKAQSEIRKRKDLISIYIDVKSLHEIATSGQSILQDQSLGEIDPSIYQAHMLRKNFLGEVLSQLLIEVEAAAEALTLFQRWGGRKRGYKELIKKLESIAERVKKCELAEEELPILRQITAKAKVRNRKLRTRNHVPQNFLRARLQTRREDHLGLIQNSGAVTSQRRFMMTNCTANIQT